MSVAVAHSVQFPGNETPNCHRFLHTGGWFMSPRSGLCTSLARPHFNTEAAISRPTPDDQLFSCFWPGQSAVQRSQLDVHTSATGLDKHLQVGAGLREEEEESRVFLICKLVLSVSENVCSI